MATDIISTGSAANSPLQKPNIESKPTPLTGPSRQESPTLLPSTTSTTLPAQPSYTPSATTSVHAAQPLPASTPRRPLRPIQDILARLTWDTEPSYSSSAFPSSSSTIPTTTTTTTHIIGYSDRHAGILEKPLSLWQRDVSSDDFIPLHRVRYVKLRRRRAGVNGGDGGDGGGTGTSVSDDPDDLEARAKARADEAEAREVIMRLEERMRATGSEEVRSRLGEMVRGLRDKWGFGDEDVGVGGERDGEDEGEDVVLWDRETRIDRIFGSGNGSGGTSAEERVLK